MKMKRNLSHISVPFPPRLMSSSRNATNMPFEFAREVRNMITSLSGAGNKRNGFTKFGVAILGEKIVTLIPFIAPSGFQLLAHTESGKVYQTTEGESWHVVMNNYSASGKLRYVHFAGKLVICNGVNDVMAWDGSQFKKVSQWIEEKGVNLTKVSNNIFSVEGDVSDYPVGKLLKLTVDGVDVEASISSSSQAGDVTTVTLSSAVLTGALSKVCREEKPPKFNYIYAAHDRLWGFGSAPVCVNQNNANADNSFVFYTDSVNDETAWRNDSGSLQYINLSNKVSVLDEVLAMAVKDGLTLFFLRNHVQVWSGYDPTSTGDMSWQKTIPVGIPHGDLVATLPNDIAFFTKHGVRTISRVLQTEQLDVSDLGSEVDPSLADSLERLASNSTHYIQNVHNFVQARQGWYGFHIAGDCYVFQLGGVTQGWSVFDGIFSDMTAACTLPDGRLFVAKHEQIYSYDTNVYSDDGLPIKTKWWTPWLNGERASRWANKYVEVLAEHGQAIPLTLKRFKNYNNASFVESMVQVEKEPDYWDESAWDDAFWDYSASAPAVARDAYIADALSYQMESDSTLGPLTIYGMKLHGVREK